MKILEISAENYRNLKIENQKFCDGVNFIYGENAQGKTNLIESIWMLTGARSFRGTKDSDIVEFGKDFSRLKAVTYFENREQEIKLIFSEGKRKAFLSDVPQKYPTELIGRFRTVLFSPIHLSLVSGGPEKRRKFLDAAICQLKPTYTALLIRYNHILRQRNSFLKNPAQKFNLTLLDVLDSSAANLGSLIIRQRLEYMKNLAKQSAEIYSEISGDREKLAVSYISRIIKNENMDFKHEEIEKILIEKMYKTRNSDLKFGITSVGPHKDDLGFYINDKTAKSFGSQGQQRSVALALKLAEADILTKSIGEPPVILLDDVMSELDDSRKSYMIQKTKNRQVFITACDNFALNMAEFSSVYTVKSGKIFDGEADVH